MRGPKTVEEFMALPIVGLYDTQRYTDARGVTHVRPLLRKASVMFMEPDTIFTVTDHRTGEMWTLHGEGRRLV